MNNLTKINNKILVPSVILLTILFASIYSANRVLAEDTLYPRIVTRLAEKFNLSEEDVNEVFEEDHAAMWQDRQVKMEERLSEAVSAGVITEEQKTLLLTKMNEWQADRSALRQEHREEMESWMEENGINHDSLRQYMGFGGHGGFGKGMGMRFSQ